MSVTCTDVLKCAQRISSALGLPNTLDNISDVDFQFLRKAVGRLTGENKHNTNSECRNIQSIVDRLSYLIKTPLSHIETHCFNEYPKDSGEERQYLRSLFYLLEIVEFLADYSRSCAVPSLQTSEEKPVLVNRLQDTPGNMRYSPDQASDTSSSVAVTEIKESQRLDSRTANISSCQRSVRSVVVTTSDDDVNYLVDVSSVADSMNSSVDSKPSNKQLQHGENEARLEYLREKIRECLITNRLTFGEDCSLSRTDNSVGPARNSLAVRCGELCKGREQSVSRTGQPSRRRSAGLIRPSARPLGRPNLGRSLKRNTNVDNSNGRADGCFPEQRQTPTSVDLDDEATVSLDKVLQSFPMLTLDEHDRRILRRRAMQSNAAGLLTSPASKRPSSLCSDRAPNWIEERQHRRLAMLLRHQRQQDRLQERRTNEATQRRLLQEVRDHRRQLVRSRKYFKEFFQQFRARKLAKVAEEEQVFRQFFKQLLDTEAARLRELKKLKHEDKLRREAIREKELDALEHAHRTRMEVVSEVMQKERTERQAQFREEQIESIRQKRDLRRLLVENIRELQESVIRNKDSASFREKDAFRLLQQR